jgi:hypothetical protein
MLSVRRQRLFCMYTMSCLVFAYMWTVALHHQRRPPWLLSMARAPVWNPASSNPCASALRCRCRHAEP